MHREAARSPTDRVELWPELEQREGIGEAAVPRELYVNGHTFEEYLDYLRRHHRHFYDLLSPERWHEARRQIAASKPSAREFEDVQAGGRGASYNVAQRRAGNRHVGMSTLLNCLWPCRDLTGEPFKVVDVLGGDGTFARFCSTLPLPRPTIYTADISKFMIDACHAQGLPCLRQSATSSLFRDGVLDGVLIAYGSHHLDSDARPLALREGYRTLRAGGRLVLHDFEVGGRTAQWFEHVVHPYSRTGHPHAHFSRGEIVDLFTSAGFRDVRVSEISDPFTLHGSSPDEARDNAIMHMYYMYDLIKVADAGGDIAPRVERHIADTLGPIGIRQERGRYVAQIPRRALVAVGLKRG